jgi:hypothetical protein
MALEWPPGVLINVDNFPFGIAWEVDADIDIDFCHLLINLCLYQVSVLYVSPVRGMHLFLWFGLLDVGLQLARD